MKSRGPSRPHPCLPVPLAERRRLALAAHLALQAMNDGHPAATWLDLPAAVAVAGELLEGREVDEDVLQAVERAGRALVRAVDPPTPTDEAKAACSAFLPYYEATLAAVTWRRLQDAQLATAAAWRAQAAG